MTQNSDLPELATRLALAHPGLGYVSSSCPVFPLLLQITCPGPIMSQEATPRGYWPIFIRQELNHSHSTCWSFRKMQLPLTPLSAAQEEFLLLSMYFVTNYFVHGRDMAYNMLTLSPPLLGGIKTKRELVQSLHDAEIMIHKQVSSEGTCKCLACLQQRRDNVSTKANQDRHSMKSQITGQTSVPVPSMAHISPWG